MASLQKLALHGTLWTILGYGASQALRLGGNLILTRLLVPDMFGLMALVNVFIMGLNLFSDLGIGLSIIQNPRGNEANFLNTAWTIQVIRGFGLWIACFLIAIPAANFYGDRQLLGLIIIVGFSTVIAGFNSTALFTLNRSIALGRLTRMEFTVQLLGLLVMIAWAAVSPTIWALVVGNLFSGIVKLVWSHRLLPEQKNRFAWDKSAVTEIIKFGRWIFFATAMMFLATQADRLILGKLFSLEMLGIYTIAYTFADIPRQILNRLNGMVMFPVISKQIHLPRLELRQKILEKRRLLLLGLAIGLSLMIVFGDGLIFYLYDARYHAGAWMVPLLSAGLWLPVLAMTIDPVLYALAKPQGIAFGNFAKFAYMLIFIPLSYHLYGTLGAIIVIAANDFPFYLAVTYGVWREQLSGLRQDLTMTGLLLTLVAILLLLRWQLGFALPISTLWQS